MAEFGNIVLFLVVYCGLFIVVSILFPALIWLVLNCFYHDSLPLYISLVRLIKGSLFFFLCAFYLFFVRVRLLQFRRISSKGTVGSMSPTLLPGDIILVENISRYLGRPIKRGDILSFKVSDNIQRLRESKLPFMKRIIGLPGDKIEVIKGKGIYINELLIDESAYIKQAANYDLHVLGDIGGKIGNTDFSPYKDSVQANNAIIVPDKHLFLLGDNRNNSLDSHILGFVRQTNILYKFWFLFWRRQKEPASLAKLLSCSFCQKAQNEVTKLITASPTTNICDHCVIALTDSLQKMTAIGYKAEPMAGCLFCKKPDKPAFTVGKNAKICGKCLGICRKVLSEHKSESISASPNNLLCSFCGKTQHEVFKLVAGPLGANICDTCVSQTTDALDKQTNQAKGSNTYIDCSFCKTMVKAELAISAIDASTRICDSCLRQSRKQLSTEKTLEQCSAEITTNPHNWHSYADRAGAYTKTKEYSKAIEDWSKVIELDPKNVIAYGARAECYESIKESQKAIADWTNAITLKPDSFQFYKRAHFYSGILEHDKAIEDYNKSIELLPTGAAFVNRSYDYLKINQFDQAIADCNAALLLDADDAIAYNNRARALIFLGRYQEALIDINKAILLNSTGVARFYYNRACTYKMLEQYEKAIDDFTITLKMDAKLIDAYKNRADTYEMLGQDDLAAADRKSLKDYSSSNPSAQS